jgi:hypothetical protein
MFWTQLSWGAALVMAMGSWRIMLNDERDDR